MIKIGDKVQTAVYLGGNRHPMAIGIVVDQSFDGSVSKVDVMSMHGGAPWIRDVATAHLRKVETENK